MILQMVQAAVDEGATQLEACRLLGVDPRMLQRWKKSDLKDDLRAGPKTTPKNKLTESERNVLVERLNSKEFRDMSPKQIIPKLADMGVYIASESSAYRLLRDLKQMKHREKSKSPTKRRPKELEATKPKQAWCWDITYLRTNVRGKFFYLYLVLDIWSRKIVATAIHENEDGGHAAGLMKHACKVEGVSPGELALHSDNGNPMRCGTFLSLLHHLGIAPSFSRPSVSNDNPFVESLFRTLKYRPNYPDQPFATKADAEAFIRNFVHWYNNIHLHSGIKYVTPNSRHSGAENALLKRRTRVYEAAKARRPDRWTGQVRSWEPNGKVVLNPQPRATQERPSAVA